MMIRSIKEHIDHILAWTLVALMGANVLNVLWQVFTRFILNNPSSYTEELARYLLIWVGLLGAAYAVSKKLHLAIDIVLQSLHGRKAYLIQLLIQLLMFLFAFTVMIVGGMRLVMITLTLNQVSPALGIKLGYIYLALPLSGILMVTFNIIEFWQILKQLLGFQIIENTIEHGK